MKSLAVIVISTLALVAAGCGGDDSNGAGDAEPSQSAGSPGAVDEKPGTVSKDVKKGAAEEDQGGGGAGTAIKVAESEFGQVLFDGSDQAIYLFDKESRPQSECYGACAEAWPPVLTKGQPAAGEGADAELLGTTERTDGTTQVTYNGHPLYYYVDDPPGQILCHDVLEFGGLWLVIDPAGDAVS